MKSNKIGRNDVCHCGSGLKWKKCCMNKKNKSINIADLKPGQSLNSDEIDAINSLFNPGHELCERCGSEVIGSGPTTYMDVDMPSELHWFCMGCQGELFGID